MTYTPGPWSVTNGHLIRVMKGPACVAGVHRIGRYSGAENEACTLADARLIAAAPTMAEYIKKRAGVGDAEAEAIWAKATGENA